MSLLFIINWLFKIELSSAGTLFESNWDRNMEHREPYYLTNDNLMAGFAEITCIVCFINIQIKWYLYIYTVCLFAQAAAA